MEKAKPEIQIVPSMEELALAAALHFICRGKSAIEEKRLFTVALSSDAIPEHAYSRLTADAVLSAQLSWDSVHCFCTDARHTGTSKAPRHDRAGCAGILEKFPLPPDNVHRIKVKDSSAHRAADDYERQLRRFFALKPSHLPRFDLVLLGIGTDGHTASLYPASKALRERDRLVIAHRVDALNDYDIAMTVPVLHNAAGIIFLVSGDDKAAVAREVLNGQYRPYDYPAQAVGMKHPNVLWLMDRAAARLLRDYPGTG